MQKEWLEMSHTCQHRLREIFRTVDAASPEEMVVVGRMDSQEQKATNEEASSSCVFFCFLFFGVETAQIKICTGG